MPQSAIEVPVLHRLDEAIRAVERWGPEAWSPTPKKTKRSVAVCSPAKSFRFSGLMENPLVGKRLKS